DRADNHALADVVLGFEPVAERVDDADRLGYHQDPLATRILALHDVNVGAANGGRGHANHGLSCLGRGSWPLLDRERVGSTECNAFHGVHMGACYRSARRPIRPERSSHKNPLAMRWQTSWSLSVSVRFHNRRNWARVRRMPGISAKSSRIAPSSGARVGRQAVARPDMLAIEVIMSLLLRRQRCSIGNHPIAICRA